MLVDAEVTPFEFRVWVRHCELHQYPHRPRLPEGQDGGRGDRREQTQMIQTASASLQARGCLSVEVRHEGHEGRKPVVGQRMPGAGLS
jgi:hypothetical protein